MKLGKTLVLPLAGLLLIGVAGAALATSATAPAADTGSVVPAAASPTPAPAGGATSRPDRGGAISEVLDTLVAKGTITAAQKTAILDALAAERAERQAERTERRAERKAEREKIKGFLADGVITKAELEQLSADHPLRQLTTLMDDGKITLDEIKAIGRGAMKGMGLGGGRGWMHEGKGGGMWGGGMWGPNPAASPSTGG